MSKKGNYLAPKFMSPKPSAPAARKVEPYGNSVPPSQGGSRKP